nr:hypothetical protein [Tanacetum cinerariifolium]
MHRYQQRVHHLPLEVILLCPISHQPKQCQVFLWSCKRGNRLVDTQKIILIRYQKHSLNTNNDVLEWDPSVALTGLLAINVVSYGENGQGLYKESALNHQNHR